MKKFLSYILISLIIGANLLAPISVGWNKNNLEVKSNKAEAAGISITNNAWVTNKTITGTIRVAWQNYSIGTSGEQVEVFVLDVNTGKILDRQKIDPLTNVDKSQWVQAEISSEMVQTGTFSFPTSSSFNIQPNTQYKIETAAAQGTFDLGTLWTDFVDLTLADTPSGAVESTPLIVTTNDTNNTTSIPAGQQTAINEDAYLPNCAWNDATTWGGCIGRLLFWGLFKPTSYIFALTGHLLDLSIDYSTKDTSFRSSFVVEGWGIVRDFCNMFFIFVLLYIAFKTILGLGASKTKEMVINVVIIGLLINFSLFATQVIIDASNILTKVFYNSQSIAIGPKDASGVIQDQRGSNGEIKISEALVSKINPQRLILEASKVDNIQTSTNATSNGTTGTTTNVSANTFILVTILATTVNIVGLITFLMCSLIFISRVIGLWLAMIFAPLAFFSYTIPALQDMEMIGWKKWWPETLKMAFLAPVFIFFMYLIIKFLETGLGLVINDNASGMNFLLGIFIPFIFIMILLTKAKDIAKKMSGTMGEKITNGLATAGGIALGATAVGTAFLGRNVIGGGLAAASRSDSAMHLATQKFEHNKKLEEWETNRKNGVAQGAKPVFIAPKHGDIIKDANGNAKKDAKGNDIKYKDNSFTRLGASLNEKQMKVGGIDFARSQIDETKKAAGLEGVDDTNLSGVNEKKMKDTFTKTKMSEAETQVRNGVDAKGNQITLKDESGQDLKHKDKITGAESTIVSAEDFKSKKRDEVEENYRKANKIPTSATLDRKDTANIENELNKQLNAAVKATVKVKIDTDYNKLRTESKQKVGGVERAFSRTNTGSWDARKLSEGKSDQREGMFTKIPVALIAGIAMGVRGGLKSVGTSSGGVKVEGNFMKDLGNTISDSLKGMKVNVNLEHVGETKSSADAHGGVSGAHH